MEAGRGIQACVAGHELICGSEAFLRSRDITLDDGAASRLGRLHEQGKATVLAAEKDRCLGVIALSLMGLLTPTSGALVHNAGSVFVVLIAALLYDRKFE